MKDGLTKCFVSRLKFTHIRTHAHTAAPTPHGHTRARARRTLHDNRRQRARDKLERLRKQKEEEARKRKDREAGAGTGGSQYGAPPKGKSWEGTPLMRTSKPSSASATHSNHTHARMDECMDERTVHTHTHAQTHAQTHTHTHTHTRCKTHGCYRRLRRMPNTRTLPDPLAHGGCGPRTNLTAHSPWCL